MVVKLDVSLAQQIEEAMEQAIHDTQTDSEVIWAETETTPEDKAVRIAALNDPETLRARMMQYRDKLVADWTAAVNTPG